MIVALICILGIAALLVWADSRFPPVNESYDSFWDEAE